MPSLLLKLPSPEPRKARDWDSGSQSTDHVHCSRPTDPGAWRRLSSCAAPASGDVLPSASLTPSLSLSLQLKSNVLSFDCHISKYAVICEQLKAEVRCWRGWQGSVFSCGLLGTWTSELLGIMKPSEQQMILPCRCQICGRSFVPMRMLPGRQRTRSRHHWLSSARAQGSCPGEGGGTELGVTSWCPPCQEPAGF